MFLREVTDNPLVTKLVAITDQLKSDIDKKKIKNQMSVRGFIKYLSDYDIVIDKNDLYTMVKKAPLSKFISNIEDDKIVFKGQEKSKKPEDTDKNKEVVKQMAKSAQKPE